VNQDLDIEKLIKTGLTIQASFAACPLSRLFRKRQKSLFHTIYEIRKINRTIDYEKDNEYKRRCPTDELWKLPVVIACILFLHIH